MPLFPLHIFSPCICISFTFFLCLLKPVINISLLSLERLVCLLNCLYLINMKAAESIGLKKGLFMSPGNVYGLSKIQKCPHWIILIFYIFKISKYKIKICKKILFLLFFNVWKRKISISDRTTRKRGKNPLVL